MNTVDTKETAMGAIKPRWSKEEFAKRGNAIFEELIRPHLKGKDENDFVAIDIESGAYEIDRSELTASQRLRARVPEAQIWLRRVGSRFAHRFGGRRESMITGVVNAHLEPSLRLTVRGFNGERSRIRAVLDTGFDGWLSLPPRVIAQLGLPWDQRGEAILADGSETIFDIYVGVVVWDRGKRTIPIHESDTTPLLGTALLAEHELRARFQPRGKVVIKRIGRR